MPQQEEEGEDSEADRRDRRGRALDEASLLSRRIVVELLKVASRETL